MRIRHGTTTLDKIELQMTPMIDIVFQLNMFFLFTFKIVLPEGDFNIRMPSAAAARGDGNERNAADDAGDEGRRRTASWPSCGWAADRSATAATRSRGCTSRFAAWSNDAGGPGTASELEVEIDADYDLQLRARHAGDHGHHRLHRKRRAAQADRARQVHAAEEERGVRAADRGAAKLPLAHRDWHGFA